MTRLLCLLALVLTICAVEGKHIHPRSIVRMGEIVVEDGAHSEKMVADIDGMPIDVIRHLKLTRFVPINNELFFRTYPPCEEGLERDLLGICREVWD